MPDMAYLKVGETSYKVKDITAQNGIGDINQAIRDLPQIRDAITTNTTNISQLQTATQDLPQIRDAIATNTRNITQLQTASQDLPQIRDAITTNTTNITQLQTATQDLPDIRQNIEQNTDDIRDLKSAIEHKADVDGIYEELTAGNILSSQYVEDSTPYLFRASGGGVKVGNLEYDTVVGGTVEFNQLMQSTSAIVSPQTFAGVEFTKGDNGAWSISGTATDRVYTGNLYNRFYTVANHVYAIIFSKPITDSGICLRENNFAFPQLTKSNILKCTEAINTFFTFDSGSDITGTAFDIQNLIINIFDLTQMLGANVAEHFYSLETATAGAGVNLFKSLFPASYYPYNAGSLESVQGLVSHDMIGFNQWDGESEQGYLDSAGSVSINIAWRYTDYIRVFPNTTYYLNNIGGDTNPSTCWYDSNKVFISGEKNNNANSKEITSPENARYARVSFSAGNTGIFGVNISGSRNGEYEPYEKHSYPLDSSVILRGVPVLINEKLSYDGDIYSYDGKIQRRYSIVDLGTLHWNYFDDYRNGFYAPVVNRKIESSNFIIAGYTFVGRTNSTTTMRNMESHTFMVMSSNYNILVKNTAYTDAASFKAAMSGVMMVYELATPTEETTTAYAEIQKVDAYGTEEYVVSDSIVPVGHNTKYPKDLKAKLEELPTIPDAPTTDGTYKLIATVTNGTIIYSWEANT